MLPSTASQNSSTVAKSSPRPYSPQLRGVGLVRTSDVRLSGKLAQARSNIKIVFGCSSATIGALMTREAISTPAAATEWDPTAKRSWLAASCSARELQASTPIPARFARG